MTALDPSVQVALIGAAVTIVVTLLELFRRKLNTVEEHAKESRAQVQNSHKTNLRDDIDNLHDDVRQILTALERHGGEISGLRKDMRVEREERMALSSRVDHALVAQNPVTVAVNTTDPKEPA